MADLNELAKEIHQANAKWWYDLETGKRLDRNQGEMLMLVVSELAECMEGERKGLRDEHLPHRMMAEVELADVKIRVLDFAGGFDYPLCNLEVIGGLDNRAEMLLKITSQVVLAYRYIKMGYVREDIGYILSTILSAVDSYAAICGYDVDGAMAEKRAYNATRKDHTREARLAEGGKRW